MTGAFAELYSWCPIVTTAPEKGGGEGNLAPPAPRNQ